MVLAPCIAGILNLLNETKKQRNCSKIKKAVLCTDFTQWMVQKCLDDKLVTLISQCIFDGSRQIVYSYYFLKLTKSDTISWH